MRTVLGTLAADLEVADITFQVGGSALLHALGLVESVRDLDIVFPTDAADALGAYLTSATGVQPSFDSAQEPGFVSDWRCRHPFGAVELDLTGGVALQIDGSKVPVPFTPGGTWFLEGIEVPLAPPEHWLLIYRQHRSARAKLLEPLVEPNRWDDLKSLLGLDPDAIPVPVTV